MPIFRAGRVPFPLLCVPFQTATYSLWLCHPCSQATLATEHSTKAHCMLYLFLLYSPPSDQSVPAMMHRRLSVMFEPSFDCEINQAVRTSSRRKQVNKIRHCQSVTTSIPSTFIAILTSAAAVVVLK